MKKFGLLACMGLITLGLVGCNNSNNSNSVSSNNSSSSNANTNTKELPTAWGENPTYQAGECSITINPEVTNAAAAPLKDYMSREEVRYVDLRDASEGYGLGHIAGFETASYFKVIVGEGCLFTQNSDGTFTANYEESEAVLNNIFPKDQTYFFMCQVGGRVTPFLTLLAQYDYDMTRIYNVGGWNQLKDEEDKCGLKVSTGIAASAITYDFSSLTPVEEETASLKTVRKVAAKATEALPTAWGENPTYKAGECSITINPEVTNAAAAPLKDYMSREEVRYVDLRDASEGYGLGHIAGFETASYFKVIVGEGCLFTQNSDGTFTANYEESEAVLNNIFPKDQTYFFMCQVGGRVTPFLTLLAQYDYDMTRIYNVGGWNQLKDEEDKCGLKVSTGIAASAITYDFSSLTPVEA